LFIVGRVMMIPKHYVLEFNKPLPRSVRLAIRLSSNKDSIPVQFEWSDCIVHSHPHQDWSLVMLPRVVDEKATILNHFATRKQDLTRGPFWAGMLVAEGKGFQVMPSWTDFLEDKKYDTMTSAEGYSMSVGCDVGSCGFPYIATDDEYPQPMIFAMHTAGINGMKHAYGSAVFIEDIKDLLAMFPVKPHSSSMQPIHCVSMPSAPHMMIFGDAEPVQLSTKSVHVPAPLYGIMGQPTKYPSRLTSFKDDEGQWVNPMVMSMSECSKNLGYANPRLYEEASRAQIQFIFKHSTPVPVEVGPLTYEEAVIGRPGVFKGIDMDTSCGYGYSNKGISKKDIFWKDGELNLNTPASKELKLKIEYMRDRMADREFIPDVVIDTLKAELLSEEKVRLGKSRMFNVYQLHRYILARMYFMPFVAWVVENCMNNGFTLGMNVYKDFNLFQKFITSKGTKIISGDVKWFDKRQMIIGFYCFFDFVNAFYIGCNPLDKNVRDMFMVAVMRTLHVQKVGQVAEDGRLIISDKLVEWFGSLTSGWLLTAHAGSFMNGTNLMYCIADIRLTDKGGAEAYTGEDPFDWNEFYENVAIFKNGDDNVINVSDEWSETVTQSSMMSSSAKIDMIYTPEHKGAITVEHRNYDEIEFLKRMFIWHAKFRYMAGALRKESIIEMLNWTGRVFKKEQYCDTIDQALMEWSAWGEDEFNRVFPIIEEASIRELSYVPLNNTYEKAFRAYMGTNVDGFY